MVHVKMPDTYASQLLEDSIRGITSFYLMREQSSGGFSAGRYMPATLEDTYYAVSCLKLLDNFITGVQTGKWNFPGAVPVETHMEFLKNRLSQEWSSSRRLFHILYCFNALRALTPENTSPACSTQSVINFLKERIRIMPVLDECFYALRTGHLGNNEMTISLDNLPPLTDYSIKSLAELRMLLYLARHGDNAEFVRISRQWLPWLKRCMNYDGGYGFFPGTTSYIENMHHAMESYRIMERKPEASGKSVGFIRASRSARGGFGRRCQGIPFPDSTWQATASLVFLTLNCGIYSAWKNGEVFERTGNNHEGYKSV